MTTLPELLKAMIKHRASDMHITSGSPPTFRVHGHVVKTKLPSLTPEVTRELCFSILDEKQQERFERDRQLDLSFGIRDVARFRANVFYQRGAVAGAFRHIPFDIPKMADLGLPSQIHGLIHKPRGLFLVTGSTGSGKSTTLASMIDALNDTESIHIVTIEDPIEYIHAHRKCIINQREVGQDTRSFASALKASLREDPDVVLVGEMRDRETIETALTLAETGHLVFSTLHTNSAYQSITRIVQVFPVDYQEQIRLQLSMVLEAIITQALVPKANGQGRALALELLIPTPSVRHLIRENKIFQIPSAMLVGQDTTGMFTLNQSLVQLVKRGVVDPDAAMMTSSDPDDLAKNLAQLRNSN